MDFFGDVLIESTDRSLRIRCWASICTHPTVSTVSYAVVPFSNEHFTIAVLKESYVRGEGPCW